MNRSAKLVVGLGVGCGLAGAWFSFAIAPASPSSRRAPSAQTQAAAGERPADGSADREIARMGHKLSDLSREIETLAAIQADSQRDDFAPDLAPEPPASEESLDAEEYFAAQAATLSLALDTGSRDAWATETEAALFDGYRQIIGDAQLDIVLSEVACTSELCRIRLSADEEAASADDLARLGTAMPWQGERFFELTPGEHPSLVVYAANENAALPRAEPGR